ncbi:DUF5979 domain-containing protein [Microbacterium halophytorum]|uniref:DUF5979 domain-containing protein n=1 Tax=Microbacterium halophytorum TaxID=2067568 RepID=UPI000CFC6360|nr:DUF5979 domain-containing protein [Microbacterium halophytorum]
MSKALSRHSAGGKSGSSRFGRVLAAGVAALLVVSAAVIGDNTFAPTAAQAATGAFPQLTKQVDGQDAHRDLAPGESVDYTVQFSTEDAALDSPVTVVDVLPEAFAGWQISGLSANIPNYPGAATVEMPGVTPGTSGTVGATEAERTITVDVEAPLDDGSTGMPTGSQGLLTYTLTVPSDLAPDWEYNNADLTNTVTYTGTADPADPPVSITDDAIISVNVPITVDVTPSKTWEPAAQPFEPGAASTMTIGGTQASNVNATSFVLQDPTVADDGAATLDASNPFRYVDFAGFATDPTTDQSGWPEGATEASVEAYVYDGSTWNWTTYDGSIADADVAGIRITYTGDIPPEAVASQAFDVAQRADDRIDGTALNAGYNASNVMSATVTVDGEDPVTQTSNADFAVTPVVIDVNAGKAFIGADGAEVENLETVSGNEADVVITGQNAQAPDSSNLDSLTISEPGEGANAAYFSDDIAFVGFSDDLTYEVWPEGATGGSITWYVEGGEPITEELTVSEPLPDPPAGETVTGFDVTFTGAIPPGATSQIRYTVDTDENLAPDGGQTEPYVNTIDVEGTSPSVEEPATDSDDASLVLVAPAIVTDIEKQVSPAIVFPGDNVIVELPTTTTTTGDDAHPTEIIVTDQWQGEGTFWDAFDLTQIVAPIDVPEGSTLTVERYDETDQAWVEVATLTETGTENIPVPEPEDTTGIRFTYSNPAGFGATTDVQPNLMFVARDTLRSTGETTSPNDGFPYDPTPYTNTARSDATGQLDTRLVVDDDEATDDGSIRHLDGDIGPLWNDKNWTDDLLVSQSGAESSTVQRWAVTEAGFTQVTLTDPAAPTADGAGTVFEAFDLLRVDPILIADEPEMEWDDVVDVQLYDGADWVSVAAPDGSWMNDQGFKGYQLTNAERQSTLGIRLVLEPDDAGRQAAIDAGRPDAPGVGTGIMHTGDIRSYTLDWRLRNEARPDGGEVKWVTSSTPFNCAEAAEGCIDNTFEMTGTRDDGTVTADADDMINLIDGTGNVQLSKTVDELPDGEAVSLIAPKPGDLDQADYPTTSYTLTAENASSSESGKGVMKLSRVRVTDVATDALGATDMATSPFEGRDFDAEAASAAGNHWDEFNVTGISFQDLPSYIDKDQSTVELWLYNGGSPTTANYSIAEIEAGAADADLADAIGVSVTYQGTDPETNGNRIVAGDDLTMRLDVQLRAEHRSTGEPVEGGEDGVPVSVPNEARTLGQDVVINPDAEPADEENAEALLDAASIDVGLTKDVTVGDGGTTLIETDPDAPVHVNLVATPGETTAPLSQLTIEDTTAEFWEKFELVSLPEPGAVPTDSDQYSYDYFVDGAWVAQDDFTGELTDVYGVRITFDRADGEMFPLGATSWTSGWGSAELPIDVQLRDPADVDWDAGLVINNEALAIANGSASEEAEDRDPAQIDFSPGEHRITVSKRAPLDESSHTVDPLASNQWQLIFTNDGTSYLPIETITDYLPADLTWDGAQPTYERTDGGSLPIDPEEIAVALSDDGSELSFTWPEGSRMQPGETVTINLGLILEAGVAPDERVWNAVVAETGVDLVSCTQPTEFGQDATNAPETGATECGNANYVQPREGTLVGAQKFVNGEYVDTLGEDLVSGEVNTATGEAECTSPSAPADYTRTPCADYTAVGGTDHWQLNHVNAGTDPLTQMTIVDMLPRPGDRLLAGGGDRNSTWQSVLDTDSILLSGDVSERASGTIEVTTDPTACIGSDPSSSMWPDDPECDDPTNPGNASWVSIYDYTGADQDIVGIRFVFDIPEDDPLQPGEWINIWFDTVNRVVDQTDLGLQPTLEQYQEEQFAWNQNGVTAIGVSGDRVDLVKAPEPAGVTLKTGSLELSKTVVDNGVTQIPDSFDVELVCTVPSGVADPERVALDLGESSTVTLPADGTPVTLDGLPIGTDCTVTETGEVGEYGEIARTFQSSPGVTPSADGMSAEVEIRERPLANDVTTVGVTNTYALGQLVVEKSVVSGNDNELTPEQTEQTFDFSMTCVAGDGEPLPPVQFELTSGEQQVFDNLPVGTVCDVEETGTGGAESTTISVNNGEPTDGTSSGDVEVTDEGAHVLATNTFSNGGIVVSKRVVSGNDYPLTDDQLAQTYDFTIVCTDPDGTEVLNEEFTLAADAEQAYDGMPVGTACDVTETGTGGAMATTVTVDGAEPADGTTADDVPITDDAATVAFENSFSNGEIIVSKTISSGNDNAVTDDQLAQTFDFSVVCTTPDGTELDPVTFTLAADEEFVLDELPVGTECDVTETDAGGAQATTVTVAGETTDGTSVDDVTVADEATEVAFDNAYSNGGIVVSKTIVSGNDNPLTDAQQTQTFDFSIVCVDPDGTEVLNDEFALGADEEQAYDGMVVGTECAVTETGDGGAAATTVTVNGGDPTDGTSTEGVVIADDTATVAFENSFSNGEIVVSKTISAGNDNPLTDEQLAETFDFEVVCTTPDGDVLDPVTFTLAADEEYVYDELPVGSECDVTETNAGTSMMTTITVDGETTTGTAVDDVTVADDPTAVAVDNVYADGGLVVDKSVVSGNDNPLTDEQSDQVFAFSIVCVDPDTGDELLNETFELADGGQYPVEGLPVGTECEVTETDDGGAAATTITVNDAEPTDGTTASGVVIADDTTNVAFENSFSNGGLVVQKSITSGNDYELTEEQQNATFAFELACTTPDGTELEPVGFELQADEEWSIDELPVGTECELTETDAGGAPSTSITVNDGEPVDGTSAVVTIADDTATAAVANTFSNGQLIVEKQIGSSDGNELAADAADQTFVFEAVCTTPEGEELEPVEFELADGEQRIFEGLPLGTECAVTETDDGGAATTTITVNDGDPIDGTSVEAVTVEYEATYVLVRNEFPGVPPVEPPADDSDDDLAVTGTDVIGALATALALILFGGGVLLLVRRNREA